MLEGKLKKKEQPKFDGGHDERQGNAAYQAKSGLKKKLFRSPIVRNIWMALALTDYFFQFYAKTGRLLIRGEKIVFDRFYLDLFVDQGISFGYSPEKIGRSIRRWQKLFPAMDALVYLRVSPEICFQRKDDIPGMEYLLKRYDVYEYLSRENHWICINGEDPLDEVYAEIKLRLQTGALPRETEDS